MAGDGGRQLRRTVGFAAVNLDSGAQTRVPVDAAENVWLPDPLPDGTRIVVSAANGADGSLLVLAADGSAPVSLWRGQGRFNHPAVSPDGTRIAFTAEIDDGNSEIFMIPIEGGEPRRLTNDPGIDWGPTWSTDSETITFVSDRDGDADLYIVTVDGGDPVRLTDFAGSEGAPDWSPDGSWIAFESDMDGDYEIYIVGRTVPVSARSRTMKASTPLQPGLRTERRFRS